ncbi:PaaI family thioesterase [Herbaspirillum sp. RTI4]|uniref:PaaI family thioesterase n=1 Tax=Herbaspirillum sp. RTI4 TaxID=3048640 RepID=UPI002AB45073|nr:PaaI family thioesterase [Herbaspirillum sp. RTI4]MDY7578999.1 PaaI family thioesterase [Herbaspirillum sp. RTI4]MEA9980930.1 PaaI family thioesterase [Herbaspirillum sp. RTI4]
MAIPFTDAFPLGNPFLSWLGVEVDLIGDGKAELGLLLLPHHMNSWQVAQGGLSVTMMDVAMGVAARSAVSKEQSCATVDMSTSFLQPGGHPGDRLVARAQIVHRSVTMCFCDAGLWNGDQLVAKSSGTFKYLRSSEITRKLLGASTEIWA